MTPRFLAKIENGKFIYQNPEFLADRIKKLNGSEVWVSLIKKTRGRSNNQNRYYWGVVILILSNELGYLDEEIHDTLKAKFLTDKTEKINVVRSTASLSSVEFEDYLQKIRMWASTDLGIYIPLPNEVPFDY